MFGFLNKYLSWFIFLVLIVLSSSGGFSAAEDEKAIQKPLVQVRPKCNLGRKAPSPEMLEKLLAHPAAKRGKAFSKELKPIPNGQTSYDMRTAIGGIEKAADIFPVYNQGGLGSCTANAAAGALQYLRILQGLNNYPPSRLFIYYNERKHMGDVTVDEGAEVDVAVHAIAEFGACSESTWPYSDYNDYFHYYPLPESRFFTLQPNDACYEAALSNAALAYEFLDHYRSENDSLVSNIKLRLYNNQPVLMRLSIYDSFWNNSTTGVVPIPLTTTVQVPDEKKGDADKFYGAHALMLVGYNESQFIARSSWGTTGIYSGEKGYFYLPYDYINHKIYDSFICRDFFSVSQVGTIYTITFSIIATTFWGQNIFVVGDLEKLGGMLGWQPYQALLLSRPNDGSLTSTWTSSINLAPGQTVNYKYIKIDSSNRVVWMPGPNLSFTSAENPQTLTYHWE